MSNVLPWKGTYCVVLQDMPREDFLRQRITRAFEKAQEDGVIFDEEGYTDEWRVQTLADRVFDKINPHFNPQREPR